MGPTFELQLQSARRSVTQILGEDETRGRETAGAAWDLSQTIEALIDSANNLPAGH